MLIENYKPVLLKIWEASLGILPVRNYYKALTCKATYLSKSKSVRQIKNQKVNVRYVMKNCICIYEYKPNVCTISFIIINLPKNSIRVIKSKEELEVLSDNSTVLEGTWTAQNIGNLHF